LYSRKERKLSPLEYFSINDRLKDINNQEDEF
jgi:hypothetical protein